MTKSGNGWRSGTDPVQRVMRIVAGIVALIVFAELTLDPSRGDDLGVLGVAAGVLLVLLGYESIVRLPSFLRPRDDERKDRDGPAE